MHGSAPLEPASIAREAEGDPMSEPACDRAARGRSAPSPARASYSSEMMRCVRAVHSALARSMSMPGHTPSR